jgi:hypothetical protein
LFGILRRREELGLFSYVNVLNLVDEERVRLLKIEIKNTAKGFIKKILLEERNWGQTRGVIFGCFWNFKEAGKKINPSSPIQHRCAQYKL